MTVSQVKSYRRQLTTHRKQGHKIFCGICKQSISGFISIDHIVPLSQGGNHRRENLQPTHSKCNWDKADGLVEQERLTSEHLTKGELA